MAALTAKISIALVFNPGNVLTTLVVFSQGRRTSGRCTHFVFVVFATKQNWQTPQLGHVERLEHLTLVGGAITIQTTVAVLLSVVLMDKGNASSDRNLCTDNSVSAVEKGREHMHRTTFSI
jgi:hypothetical protein